MPGPDLSHVAATEPIRGLLANRLYDPWSVDRFAQALGVSPRTLHRVFMRQFGMSPMIWLRRIRLEAARRRLQAGVPGTTVTAVALDCGFPHLGRFSGEYARKFGESPSQTLRGARQKWMSSSAGLSARPGDLLGPSWATPPSAEDQPTESSHA